MGTVFAVFKQGVYRHECGGIFSTLDEAIKCARALAENDRDEYHSYEVLPFEVDSHVEVTPPEGIWDSPEIAEPAWIFTIRKGSDGYQK